VPTLFAIKINTLFHLILYVRKNEETSNLKIVHFYQEEEGIPSELEANLKSKFLFYFFIYLTNLFSVLDEAFPEITIDLVCRLLVITPFY
jgi:hypothetical protein